jgi:hypothetical protein
MNEEKFPFKMKGRLLKWKSGVVIPPSYTSPEGRIAPRFEIAD